MTQPVQIWVDDDLYTLPSKTVLMLESWFSALADVGIDPRGNVPHAAHYVAEQNLAPDDVGDNEIRFLLALAMPWIEHRMAA